MAQEILWQEVVEDLNIMLNGRLPKDLPAFLNGNTREAKRFIDTHTWIVPRIASDPDMVQRHYMRALLMSPVVAMGEQARLQ